MNLALYIELGQLPMFIHVAIAVHRYIFKASKCSDCIIKAALHQ